MNVKIEESWRQHIGAEFDKQYFVNLTAFVRQEYTHYTCFPPGNKIFNAFNLCPFNQVCYSMQRSPCGHIRPEATSGKGGKSLQMPPFGP